MNKQHQIDELRKSLAKTDLRNNILRLQVNELERQIKQIAKYNQDNEPTYKEWIPTGRIEQNIQSGGKDHKPSYEDLKDQIRELINLDQFQWVSIDGNGDVYISTHQLKLDYECNGWIYDDEYADVIKLIEIGSVMLNGLDWEKCQWRLHELLNED
jgi:hypothetical protein